MTDNDPLIDSKSLLMFMRAALYLYCLSGLVGAVIISDSFEYLRSMLLGYIGIPLLFGTVIMHVLTPDWELSFPRLFRVVSISLVIMFTWGNLLILNATEQGKPEVVRVERNDQAINLLKYRGAFGWLYKYNF